MKKIHIIILVLIAAAIGYMIMTMGSLSTYETIASAKQKQGKFVHVIAKVDKEFPIEFDAQKDANYVSFHVIDSLGTKAKVIYNKPLEGDIAASPRIVLQGKMQNDVFMCDKVLLKCPSKYKDDPTNVQKSLKQNTQQ